MFNKKSIFSKKDFVLLWLGQVVSSVGTSLHDLAMAWFVYELTGSTLAMSASIISSFLPRALISPVAGVFADKYNRKHIIILSDILAGCTVLSMFTLATNGYLTLTAILTFNAVLSVCSAFLNPAVSAGIQSILTPEEYQDANSLNQLKYRFSAVVGALLGGLLLKLLGIHVLLLCNGVTFLLSALSESFIVLPPVRKEIPESVKATVTFAAVLRFVRQNTILLYLTLFVMVIANGLFMCLFVYMPALFRDILGRSSLEMGFYYAIEGAAASVTAIFLLNRVKRYNPYRVVVLALVLEAFLLVSHGFVSSLGGVYTLAALLGSVTTICVVMVMTIEQLLVPNEFMGRFTSLSTLLADGTMPLFTLLFGLAGQVLPLQPIIIVCGLMFLLALIPAPLLLRTTSESIKIDRQVS